MNLLDLAILVLVVGSSVNGYRRGFSLSAFSFGGMVLGTAAGAWVAPSVERLLDPGPGAGPLIGLATVLAGATTGSGLGYVFGEPLRLLLLRYPRGGRLDSVAGAVFSVAAFLLTVWFLGLVFVRGPVPELSPVIRRSAILGALDRVIPRPPGFLAAVEQILSSLPYPRVFEGIPDPELPGPVQVDPSIAQLPGIRRAAGEVVKIRSRGCGGLVYGSGFPVAADYVISNAHVVAGTTDHRISTPDGRVLGATVVLFDPLRDVSILHVPGLSLVPLSPALAARKGLGATIGYPLGGDEDIEPAAIRAVVTAVGRDIYGESEVARRIYVLQSSIEHGDSGGAFVDADGRVLGVVFAKSAGDPAEGYALTDDEVAPDVAAGTRRTTPVDTDRCAG
ncbi:MAG TPA: MarP family serine protease [Candidatus Dormibacteraeota bacterium]|nr:MarP family serine protease [Candidatus Dormibacteraeota bacterium]